VPYACTGIGGYSRSRRKQGIVTDEFEAGKTLRNRINNDESDSISINVDAEYAYMLDSDSVSDISEEDPVPVLVIVLFSTGRQPTSNKNVLVTN
jgi:Cys-tRNA synthase (O-phospho-L-seryl-tRNA:Cys-tRNA synthase)